MRLQTKMASPSSLRMCAVEFSGKGYANPLCPILVLLSCVHNGQAYYVAVVSSLVTLIGALIVFWVLMSQFLYGVASFFHST
jgi:hypothetical protein